LFWSAGTAACSHARLTSSLETTAPRALPNSAWTAAATGVAGAAPAAGWAALDSESEVTADTHVPFGKVESHDWKNWFACGRSSCLLFKGLVFNGWVFNDSEFNGIVFNDISAFTSSEVGGLSRTAATHMTARWDGFVFPPAVRRARGRAQRCLVWIIPGRGFDQAAVRRVANPGHALDLEV
jgi:hypothetical protein